MNGDGSDDLIVGAPYGDNGGIAADEAYVIYGSATIWLGGDITGTAVADRLTGTVVGERMFGLEGDDSLSGLQGDDEMRGGSGRDVLRGGGGQDVLRGGGGSDVLIGGLGQDTFIFFGPRHDRIADFEIGTDTLSISLGLTGGITDAATVVATFATLVGADVVLDFGGGRTIQLTGIGSTAGLAGDMLIF